MGLSGYDYLLQDKCFIGGMCYKRCLKKVCPVCLGITIYFLKYNRGQSLTTPYREVYASTRFIPLSFFG